MTSPAPAPARLRAHLHLVSDETAPLIQAAASIAGALRSHGLVASETAGTDQGTAILVITPGGAQLADFFGIQSRDDVPWLWHAGKPLCPATDPGTAATTITAVLTRSGPAPGAEGHSLGDRAGITHRKPGWPTSPASQQESPGPGADQQDQGSHRPANASRVSARRKDNPCSHPPRRPRPPAAR